MSFRDRVLSSLKRSRSQCNFDQQRPMIHSTYCNSSQNFSSMQRHNFRWAKDVINAPVVDGSLARVAPQIAKIFQQVSIRFAIVLGVVSEEVSLVSRADLEIEVSRDKGNRGVGLTASPIDHVGCKRAPTRGAKRICVRADQDNLREVLVQTKGCGGCKPAACGDVIEVHAPINMDPTATTIAASTAAAIVFDE